MPAGRAVKNNIDTKVVCGTQEANRSIIYDALITLRPMGCLPLPCAAPAGAVGALRGWTSRWECGTRGILAASASSGAAPSL